MIFGYFPTLPSIPPSYKCQTMRTVEETFRQAHDPNGVNGPEVSTAGVFPEAAPAATTRNAVPVRATPTILMRESSTLFRRASVSFCRRLGEADGHVLESDLMSLQVSVFPCMYVAFSTYPPVLYVLYLVMIHAVCGHMYLCIHRRIFLSHI